MVLGRIFSGEPFSSVHGLLVVIAAAVVARGVLVWARGDRGPARRGAHQGPVWDRLYRQLIELGPGHLTGARTGETQATVVDGVEALEAHFSRYLPQLAVCLTGPIVVVAWMFTQDVPVALTVLAGVLAVPLGIASLVMSGLCGQHGGGVGEGASFQGVMDDIELMGRIFGTEEVAAASVADLQERLDAIEGEFADQELTGAGAGFFRGNPPWPGTRAWPTRSSSTSGSRTCSAMSTPTSTPAASRN